MRNWTPLFAASDYDDKPRRFKEAAAPRTHCEGYGNRAAVSRLVSIPSSTGNTPPVHRRVCRRSGNRAGALDRRSATSVTKERPNVLLAKTYWMVVPTRSGSSVDRPDAKSASFIPLPRECPEFLSAISIVFCGGRVAVSVFVELTCGHPFGMLTT